MLTIESISEEVKSLLDEGKVYESYQLFESRQFRFHRRNGLEDAMLLFVDIFNIYTRVSDSKYQLEIMKLLWSYIDFKSDTESISHIVKTESLLVTNASVYFPKEEWDQMFSVIIAKAHVVSNELCHLYRNAVFKFYLRFEEYTKSLKHCIYCNNDELIGEFLSNYAIKNLPHNEWDLLIADYVLQMLPVNTPQFTKCVFDKYISCVKQALNLGDSPPYGPILLNYAKMIIDATIENKPDVIATIQKTYLPTLKQKDKGLISHFDWMYAQRYPDSVSRNNMPQSTTNLLNVLSGDIFGPYTANVSTNNNANITGNPNGNFNPSRDHDFGLD